LIELPNGHKMDFLCASGALGLDGCGYIWEKPLFYLGIIRPEELTIITKTLTYLPEKGNLRWYCPWKCFRFIEEGTINSVGLTNPGIDWWVKRFHTFPKYKFIVSIRPKNIREAVQMAKALDPLDIVGIEVNASCPNTAEIFSADKICAITLATAVACRHPVILKLGYTDPYIQICQSLDGMIAAFDLINSVPWPVVYPGKASPIKPLVGGVSGNAIKQFAREALWKVRVVTNKTPIISGGGIESYREVILRTCMGADAITFGTLFLKRPWLPNSIANKCRKVWKNVRRE
jgi:dihydroorotate dehydrogenase